MSSSRRLPSYKGYRVYLGFFKVQSDVKRVFMFQPIRSQLSVGKKIMTKILYYKNVIMIHEHGHQRLVSEYKIYNFISFYCQYSSIAP